MVVHLRGRHYDPVMDMLREEAREEEAAGGKKELLVTGGTTHTHTSSSPPPGSRNDEAIDLCGSDNGNHCENGSEEYSIKTESFAKQEGQSCIPHECLIDHDVGDAITSPCELDGGIKEKEDICETIS